MDLCCNPIAGVKSKLGACFAKFRLQLGRCEDGDVKDLAGFEEFLRGGDDFGEFVDCAAELFLKVADAASVVSQTLGILSWCIAYNNTGRTVSGQPDGLRHRCSSAIPSRLAGAAITKVARLGT